ncbi:MAG TPA: serine hydrolase [Allosphingosinicella sp.]|nr:serine hydrolase [Allosphingosinicella sp.]
MKPVAIIFACFALCAAAAQTPPGPEGSAGFEGLWSATQRFGPDVRGPLLIQSRGGALVADIAGFSVPVTDGPVLRFALPDGKGTFRGRRQGTDIVGHWIQQRTRGSGTNYATPIVLRREAPGRWRGEVRPLDDRMSYFLPVTRGADGRLTTYLRNPERNRGYFMRMSGMEVAGDRVRLVGGNPPSTLLEGRYDAEAGLLAVPIQGATYDFVRDNQESSPFFARGRNGARYVYAPPLPRDDGWPVARVEDVGISREAIERFVQLLIDLPNDGVSSHQVHSLLIARHGRLVVEEYFHGASRETPHELRSASKSWTAVLIGAAMQAGIPIRLDTPVYRTMLSDLPADLDPRKRAMTLEHLIGMTAGFDCNDSGERPGDEDPMQEQTAQPNWYLYTLAVPMARAPGEGIVYCSIQPNLAGGMLERIAGEPLPELFQRLVAAPMQMGDYHLFLQPTGEAYGGGGHQFTSRDFLKLAQLMMDGGRWHGRQITSRDWARRSTAPIRDLNARQQYGWGWNGARYTYRGRTIQAFFAAGNGGQIFMAIPDLDLAIAFTGGNYADPVLFTAQRVYIPEHILPAVN